MYKLYDFSVGKMKTFQEENEAVNFINEVEITLPILLKLTYNGDNSFEIRVKEEDGYKTQLPYLYYHEDRNKWSFTENFNDGSKLFNTANECLKSMLKNKRSEIDKEYQGEKTRYSVYDVYSEKELM